MPWGSIRGSTTTRRSDRDYGGRYYYRMQAGPSSSNGVLRQNGHQEYGNRKVASKSPSDLDLEILQERDRLRVELEELREVYKKSSDELFDMKIELNELMVLLSPYREIYEGHGIYRQWMPYEINKSQEVLGLSRPVEEEIAAENKRFAESQERGRIRRIASRIVREPDAWKLFDFVEKESQQNGSHEENAEMVKEQEAREEAQPQKAGVDQDQSNNIQKEEKKSEMVPESDQLPLVEPIEPATSVESLQGSVDELKPVTAMKKEDPFEAFSRVFLTSPEHIERMIEARRCLSQLPTNDYQLPEECNEDGPLVVRFATELSVTVEMGKFKKPIRQPQPRKYAKRSSLKKRTVQVKVEEETAKSSTNVRDEELEESIENMEAPKSKGPRGTKRAATNRRSFSNGSNTSAKHPKEEPYETPKRTSHEEIIDDAKKISDMGRRTSARRKSFANK